MLHARKLRRRAQRDAAGEFLIEGPVAVAEAIDSGVPVRELFVSETAAAEIVAHATGAGLRIHRVTDQVIDAISDAITPQGVVGIAAMPATTLDDLTTADLVVVLDEVSDPGNAGTLVRSALAAGAGGVVFGRGCVDPFGAKTVRSSSGTILRLPVVRDETLEDVCTSLRSAGLRLVGGDAEAPVAADETDLTGRLALVLGNEARGLGPHARGLVDETVRIAMPGPVESLNVAVAGSILLFECIRQRKVAGR